MKIDIILPYKEIFSENKASAVSLTVKNSFEFSKFKKKIIIYGQHTNEPFYKKNFIGIKPRRLIHFGNNLSIVKQYIKLTKNNDNKKIINKNPKKVKQSLPTNTNLSSKVVSINDLPKSDFNKKISFDKYKLSIIKYSTKSDYPDINK